MVTHKLVITVPGRETQVVTLGFAGQSLWPNQCVSDQRETPKVDPRPLYVHVCIYTQ